MSFCGPAEFSAHRERARDVGRVALVLASGVDQQQLAALISPVVVPVVQHAGVGTATRRSTGTRPPARHGAGTRAAARPRPGTRTSPDACASSRGGARRRRSRPRGASAPLSCASFTSRIRSSVPRTSTTSSGADTPVRARLRTSFSSWVTWRSHGSNCPSGVNSAGRSDASSGSFSLDRADGMRLVESENLPRRIGPVAKAVPDLPFLVLLAAEEHLPIAVGTGDQRDHRLGFRKSRQVIEIAVRSVRKERVAVARNLRCGRHQRQAAAAVIAHRLQQRAAARAVELVRVLHGCNRLSRKAAL